jgi:hypothetical protein
MVRIRVRTSRGAVRRTLPALAMIAEPPVVWCALVRTVTAHAFSPPRTRDAGMADSRAVVGCALVRTVADARYARGPSPGTAVRRAARAAAPAAVPGSL